MKERKAPGARVNLVSSCPWCLGDLCLLMDETGSPRVMCAHCGRPAPEAVPPANGPLDFESRRRPLRRVKDASAIMYPPTGKKTA